MREKAAAVDSVLENGFDIILGHSFDGCAHFKINVQFPQDRQGKGKIRIVSTDPHEIKLLKQELQIRGGKREHATIQPLVFNEKNEAEVDVNSILFCDGYSIVQITDDQKKLRTYKQKPLPEFRLLSVYNAERTVSDPTQSHFYDALSSPLPAPSSSKRIDGHTHMIGTYPMRAALERAMELNSQPKGSLYIPSLVVMHILKAKDMINKNNEQEWLEFFSKNKSTYDPKKYGKQKDSSADLINEDFNRDIVMYLSDEEKEVCFSNRQAFYIDLKTLKDKLGDSQWGDFCNGFDLDTTYPCDFTEHMEMAYTLRNWFGKDTSFLQAQLESIYDLYEKERVNYTELPASLFKRPADLKSFSEITKQIEEHREQQSKPLVTLRPSLSVARGISPSLFRKTLFEYIPLIIQNPNLASITVLAHEVNPTTAHMQAIKDFIAVIDKVRPGFTVEIHAGETEFYGEVNLDEARNIARGAPTTIVRAGHATYGNHNEYSPENYIEEKCPLSNATLIDQNPATHINVVLGIAEGKTNMFWGSDGSIYDPNCGPENQEAFFKSLIAHPICVDELERRFNAKPPQVDTFNKNNFKDYLQELAKNFNANLARNREYENDYIEFKKDEKMLHSIRLLVNYLDANYKAISPPSVLENARIFVKEAQEKSKIAGYKAFSSWLGQPDTEERLNKIYNDFKLIPLTINLNVSELNPQNMSLEIKKIMLDRMRIISNNLQKGNLTFNQATIFNYLRTFISEANGQKNNLDAWLGETATTEKLLTYYTYLQNFSKLDNSKALLSSRVDTSPTIVLPLNINPDSLSQEMMEVASSKLLAGTMIPSLEERKALEFFSNLYKLHQFYIENENRVPPLHKANWYQEIQKKLLSLDENKESITNFVNSLSRELKEDILNEINRQGLNSNPLSDQYAYKGHPPSEKLLDPNWEYLKHYVDVYNANKFQLESNSQNKAEMTNKIGLKTVESPLVLFGEPERCDDYKKQKEYMSKLYNTVYKLLEEQAKKQDLVVLLGGIEDGINPLVYKILNEHPELKEVKIRHLLTADESYNNVEKKHYPELFSDKKGHVPYLVIPGKREESHIAYSDFIEKNNINNIIMFGDDPIWSDTKTVLDQRRDQNNELFKDKIKYYEDGFNKTKTSYAYANALSSLSKETQVIKPASDIVPASSDEMVKSELYSAKLFKTMTLYRDLSHTWVALNAFSNIEEQISQQHFYNLFYPTAQDQTESRPIFFFTQLKQEELQIAKQFAVFFTQLINTSDSKKLDHLEKIFNRYGTMRHIEKVLLNVANFDLQNTIDERRQTLTAKPT